MIILGIDPGLAIVGYGVIEYKNSAFTTIDYGSIQTPAHTPVENRISTIYSDLNRIIEMYKPADMAVEELFFNTNQKTAITVAEARGVILLCAKQRGLNIYEYTPLQVKIILGLKETPKPDDTADALAIAVCHAHTGGSRLKKYL